MKLRHRARERSLKCSGAPSPVAFWFLERWLKGFRLGKSGTGEEGWVVGGASKGQYSFLKKYQPMQSGWAELRAT